MSFARILALASRIIRQVLRDRRTLALIFLVPLFVMTLLYFVLTTTSSVRTLAIVYPTGAGSDRINTLINALLPGQDKLHDLELVLGEGRKEDAEVDTPNRQQGRYQED